MSGLRKKCYLCPQISIRKTYNVDAKTPDLLRFYDYNLNYVLEPGDFDIMIGPNSRDVKKKTIVKL